MPRNRSLRSFRNSSFLWRHIIPGHAYFWLCPTAVPSLATGLSTGPLSDTRTPLLRTFLWKVKALAPWQLYNGAWVAKQSALGSCVSPTFLFYCKQRNCQNRNSLPLLSFPRVIMWTIHHFYFVRWVITERRTLLSVGLYTLVLIHNRVWHLRVFISTW